MRPQNSLARHLLLPAIAAIPLVVSLPSFANQVHEQVVALTEEKRQWLFQRMLEREGEKCQSVSRTFYQGRSRDGAAFWSVACIGGKDWQVMIKDTPTGDPKVLECAVLRSMKAGKCFTKFKS